MIKKQPINLWPIHKPNSVQYQYKHTSASILRKPSTAQYFITKIIKYWFIKSVNANIGIHKNFDLTFIYFITTKLNKKYVYRITSGLYWLCGLTTSEKKNIDNLSGKYIPNYSNLQWAPSRNARHQEFVSLNSNLVHFLHIQRCPRFGHSPLAICLIPSSLSEHLSNYLINLLRYRD